MLKILVIVLGGGFAFATTPVLSKLNCGDMVIKEAKRLNIPVNGFRNYTPDLDSLDKKVRRTIFPTISKLEEIERLLPKEEAYYPASSREFKKLSEDKWIIDRITYLSNLFKKSVGELTAEERSSLNSLSEEDHALFSRLIAHGGVSYYKSLIAENNSLFSGAAYQREHKLDSETEGDVLQMYPALVNEIKALERTSKGLFKLEDWSARGYSYSNYDPSSLGSGTQVAYLGDANKGIKVYLDKDPWGIIGYEYEDPQMGPTYVTPSFYGRQCRASTIQSGGTRISEGLCSGTFSQSRTSLSNVDVKDFTACMIFADKLGMTAPSPRIPEVRRSQLTPQELLNRTSGSR